MNINNLLSLVQIKYELTAAESFFGANAINWNRIKVSMLVINMIQSESEAGAGC